MTNRKEVLVLKKRNFISLLFCIVIATVTVIGLKGDVVIANSKIQNLKEKKTLLQVLVKKI